MSAITKTKTVTTKPKPPVKQEGHKQIENVSSMKEYYRGIYGTPKDDTEAIENLCIIFKELMDFNFLTMETKQGIGEYYRILNERNLDAYEWMLEAFHVVSKKESSKKNFPYVIGMLRSWMKYGFGHIPNQEENDLSEYFEEVTGFEITPEARNLLHNLMGTFGVIKIARMIGQLDKDKDMSYIMMVVLKDMLDKNNSKQPTKIANVEFIKG